MENISKKSYLDQLKDLSAENKENFEKQLSLVEEYEKLNKSSFYLTFVVRFFLILIIIYLTTRIYYFYLLPENFLATSLIVTTNGFFASVFSIIAIYYHYKRYSSYRDFTYVLEESMIRQLQLTVRTTFLKNNIERDSGNIFPLDNWEDFNIILKNMTKSKFEYYYKSIFFEFIIYGTIIWILFGFIVGIIYAMK